MIGNALTEITNFYNVNVLSYIDHLRESPFRLIIFIIDILIVMFLTVKIIQMLRKTRAWRTNKRNFSINFNNST